MGNIMTYLKWRGDLTFEERPFCEVDNLVLSELAYLDFSHIVPGVEEGNTLTLAKVSQLYYEQARKKTCASGPSEDFLSTMAASRRY